MRQSQSIKYARKLIAEALSDIHEKLGQFDGSVDELKMAIVVAKIEENKLYDLLNELNEREDA